MGAGDVKLACVLVGLPARGKTYISQKVARYLRWLGIKTKVYDVGDYRRNIAGVSLRQDAYVLDSAEEQRPLEEASERALDDLLEWFEDSCEHTTVAMYDATNLTRERRAFILDMCQQAKVEVMFIESICHDEEIITQNIRDVKHTSPDYAKMDPEAAAADFRARIRHYERQYETITDEDLSYVKLINVGAQVIINRIDGYLQSRIIYYLMNLHIMPRSIYISRHGESQFNVEGKIGGDSDLSERGHMYARELPNLINTNLKGDKLTVWTSTLKRTLQTAKHLPYPKLPWKALDELEAGVCDGMTYDEIAEKYPEDFANRDEDKFNYRYRGGESYRDVVNRLEPIIINLEHQRNVLIIGHQAILRCIYAYFLNKPLAELPYINVPLHTVIKLTPRAYGCEEERYTLDIDAVDTFRPKPAKHSAAPAPTMAGDLPTAP